MNQREINRGMITNRRILLVIAMILATVGCGRHQEELPPVLDEFYEAFNRHDVDGMLALADEGIRMYSVTADTTTIDIDGKARLGEWLTGYFEEYPQVQSRVKNITLQGAYVSFIEIPTWGEPGNRTSQSSLAVYKISDGKILAAWYYY